MTSDTTTHFGSLIWTLGDTTYHLVNSSLKLNISTIYTIIFIFERKRDKIRKIPRRKKGEGGNSYLRNMYENVDLAQCLSFNTVCEVTRYRGFNPSLIINKIHLSVSLSAGGSSH